MNYYFSKTPVYIIHEGKSGAIWLFLMAGVGFLVFLLGQYMEDEVDNAFLSAFGEVFIKKFGISCILTGIISGIISLF